jgi:hypothetical protein
MRRRCTDNRSLASSHREQSTLSSPNHWSTKIYYFYISCSRARHRFYTSIWRCCMCWVVDEIGATSVFDGFGRDLRFARLCAALIRFFCRDHPSRSKPSFRARFLLRPLQDQGDDRSTLISLRKHVPCIRLRRYPQDLPRRTPSRATTGASRRPVLRSRTPSCDRKSCRC